MQPAVRVHALSKQYRLGTRTSDLHPTLRDVVAGAAAAPWRLVRRLAQRNRTALADSSSRAEYFWALKDISFEVEPGEAIGIVGRNGAGKSTLLKILSRVVEPTDGYCQLRGRLGSLLEVGTGFHPELTGRENIFLNGSILGMPHREIVRKFDEIVAFAEIEKFLDTPVKRYSSGMYVRLAFAVAAHLEPEILVVDEVLAVGDANFQRKCLGKMKDVAGHGRTILFVSHDMRAVQRLCQRAVLLERGQMTAAGPVEEVIPRYLGSDTDLLRPGQIHDVTRAARSCASGDASFTTVTYHGATPEAGLVSGGPLQVTLEVRSHSQFTVDSLGISLADRNGLKLIDADTIALGEDFLLKEGINRVALQIDRVYLNPGIYALNLWLAKRPATVIDAVDHAAEVEVEEESGAVPLSPGNGIVPCQFRIVRSGI